MISLKKILIFVLFSTLLALASTCVFTIHETEIGIVTRFGRPLEALARPGLNFKSPWPIDRVMRVDQRLLIFDNEPTEMLTRDKKNVLVDSFLCWRIEDPLRFVQTVRNREEAEARLLDLTTSELGAAVGSEPMVSFLNAEADSVKLLDVALQAQEAVHRVALDSFGIAVVDLEINGFNLPRQNRKSVIERMRAERARIATAYRSEGEEEALKIEALSTAEKEQLLAEARAEAEAILGQGEAEALRLLADAYRQDPEFFEFLRSLESYRTIIDDNTTLFLESDSKLLEALNEP